MNWKENLATLGMTEDNCPPSVKKVIKDYYQLVEQYNEAKQLLKSDDIEEDEKEAMQEEMEGIRESISEMDALIVEKAEKYKKNEGHYKKMSDARNNKKKAVATAPSGVNVTPTPKGTNPVAVDGLEEPKKKGFSAGWLLLAGVVAVVTLGAVNLNNKN